MNEEERNNLEPEFDSAAQQPTEAFGAETSAPMAEEAISFGEAQPTTPLFEQPAAEMPAVEPEASAAPDFPMPESIRDAAALYGSAPAAMQNPMGAPVAGQTQAMPTQPFAAAGYAPGQQVPGQPAPTQQVPGQQVPGQPAPAQQVPGQQVAGQPAPTQQVPAQPAPAQQVPGQPGQAQPSPIPHYQPFGAARPNQQMPYGIPQQGQPYGAQPGQFGQPYGMPQQGQPYAQGMPHAQGQNPHQPGQPYQPGQPGQPGQPYQQPPMPQGTAPDAPKRKKWPIVLGVIAGILVLGLTACTAFACGAAVMTSSEVQNELEEILNESGGMDNGDGAFGTNPDNGAESDATYSYTIQDITDSLGSDLKADVSNGTFKRGIYQVGKDIEPGLYYLEGSKTEQSHYYTFDSAGNDTYNTDDSVVYFGNYFVSLEEGDLFVFLPAESSSTGYLAKDFTCNESAPYECGTYRVGVDIPAGTYTITVSDAAAPAASQDCAAFVMADLEFESNSVTDTKYVTVGSSQEVTVKDGDYLEMYATVATPSE